jgi:NADH:ubiquinone oxidoreductase subunit 2 (subunit N)
MELVFLFGIALMYVAVGTLDIYEIAKFLFFSYQLNYLFFISLFFILISFFFKIGLFPFHFYIVDLYKTVSFYAIIVFSTLPKFVYFYFISTFVKLFLDLQFFVVFNFFLLKCFYFFFFFVLLFSFFFVTFKVINEFSFLAILAYSGIALTV